MRLNHFPHWAGGPPVEPDVVERALEEWFGRHVILTSSGRAGIRLWMQAKGLHRHDNKMRVPPYMSSCVLDTIGLHAFPVQEPAEVTLWYHQYGLEQCAESRVVVGRRAVLEDIAHGFFIRPTHDAVFSLPKFFGIADEAGGIVTEDDETARRIREMRDVGTPPVPAYRPSLAGFPVDRIDEVQGLRVIVCRKMNVMVGSNISGEPFAFPYFGDDLGAKNRALSEAGIDAGVYHVDINRDMTSPDYRRCILLPCHQNVTDEHLATMERILN